MAEFIRNTWYVIAWDQEVLGDTVLERTVLGTSLVVFRDGEGRPVVLDNRCPHRHAPLSLGRRVGDALQCMYHGLRFSTADGRCIEVPGQDRIPPGLVARRYPAVQQHAWIWVWMGEAGRADPSLIPDTLSLQSPGGDTAPAATCATTRTTC